VKYLFESERLHFRELALSDAPALARVLCDAGSMRYYPAPFTEEGVSGWISNNMARYARDGFGLWAVIRKSDSAFLGDCGITMQKIDGENLPEAGFHILPEYCKNGYATEAAGAAILYVHRTFAIKKFYSYCRKENLPSQCVMRKCGMHYEKSYAEGCQILVVYSVMAGTIAQNFTKAL